MTAKPKIAQFKCLKCDHEFKAELGPVSCPICKHMYLKWMDYPALVGDVIPEKKEMTDV